MNGPMPETLAKTRSRLNTTSTKTIGMSHQRLYRQRATNKSLTTGRFAISPRSRARIAPPPDLTRPPVRGRGSYPGSIRLGAQVLAEDKNVDTASFKWEPGVAWAGRDWFAPSAEGGVEH